MDAHETVNRLAAGALRGDAETARQLVNEAANLLFFRAVRNRRTRFIGREREPSDLGQDCLTGVWYKREQYRGHTVAEFYAWFDQICYRRAISIWRRRREKTVGLMFEVERASGLAANGTVDPLDAEIHTAVDACFEELRTKDMKAFDVATLVVHAREKMTVNEVEKILGLPRSTIYACLKRARQALAECLTRKGVTI